MTRPRTSRPEPNDAGPIDEDAFIGPSPNPKTNLLLADVALRGSGLLVRRGLERGLLGKRYAPDKARKIIKGRSLGETLVGALVSRLAMRSVPGAILVGGGLLVKTLYDRRKGKAAEREGEAKIAQMAEEGETRKSRFDRAARPSAGMADQAPPRNNALALNRRGLMFVLSSPSGAGKTTISRMLLERDSHIQMSVSVTTRPKRTGEVDGRDYHFVDQANFEIMKAEGQFLEHAEVFGNMYATPRAQIEQGLEIGQDFMFDIDWQGTQQLRQSMRGHVVPVFLLPPSLAELRRRLISRGTDSEEVIERRMARARDEISHWDAYDYVLINEDIDACYQQVRTILEAERLRIERQTGLIDFAAGLMRPEG